VPTHISRGSSTGADKIFILRREGRKLLTRDGEEVEIEQRLLRTPIFATDFGRFTVHPSGTEAIIFPYRMVQGGAELILEEGLRLEFPKAYAYLRSRKRALTERAQYREWWGFSAPRSLELHDRAQLLIPLLASRGSVGQVPQPGSGYCLMASGGFSITVDTRRTKLSPRYIQGLLNSSLLFWQLKHISNKFRGGYITCTKQYVATLPIRILDLDSRSDRTLHDRIVRVVSTVIGLNEDLKSSSVPSGRARLERQIMSAERELDRLVFSLYGLTEEEMRVVGEESSGARAEPIYSEPTGSSLSEAQVADSDDGDTRA
jgi:hypothetical protein